MNNIVWAKTNAAKTRSSSCMEATIEAWKSYYIAQSNTTQAVSTTKKNSFVLAVLAGCRKPPSASNIAEWFVQQVEIIFFLALLSKWFLNGFSSWA